jgi:hypothetical protein
MMFPKNLRSLWGNEHRGLYACLLLLLVIFALKISSSMTGGSPAPFSQPLDPDVYHIPGAPYPGGLDLIFLSDGYLSWQEFDHDKDVLLREMRAIEPWKSFERYNIYAIRSNENDLCAVKTENERHPVLRCDAVKVNSYLNRLRTGHFKLVILSRRPFDSWANVARLEDSSISFSLPRSPADQPEEKATGMMFNHLLGHAFGLKDEELKVIAKADSATHQPDGPNCAPDQATAEKWWGNMVGGSVGYFKGCGGNPEYIKPTERSLMNLNEIVFGLEYGPVSASYLRKVLDYCFSEKAHTVSEDPSFFGQYPEFLSCISK